MITGSGLSATIGGVLPLWLEALEVGRNNRCDRVRMQDAEAGEGAAIVERGFADDVVSLKQADLISERRARVPTIGRAIQCNGNQEFELV